MQTPSCRLNRCRVLLCLFVLSSAQLFAEEIPAPLLNIDFDSPGDSTADSITKHKLVTLAKGGGFDNTDGIRVSYVGSDRGSERLAKRFDFKQVKEATLCFDVLFENDFRFVKGGKLFGVGPSDPRVGGEAQNPQQWSARMMFSHGGALKTYNYHQDAETHGEGKVVSDFAFEKNRYYRLSFHVKLNDPPAEKNGFTHIYIDGKRMVEDNDLQFRKVNGEKSLIQRLLFNTFHGGNSRAWAPVNDEGSLATVHARYDNFTVYPGFVVR